MSHSKGRNGRSNNIPGRVTQPPRAQQNQPQPQNNTVSLLDAMQDGNEYASIIACQPNNLDIGTEIKRAINEIARIRQRPTLCYLANMINPNIKASTAIDITDDLPFAEMVNLVPDGVDSVDVLLTTPGGSAEQVARFVDRLRSRFPNVGFIIPSSAMSAGTIFCMSADELIMDERAYIGPTDPQVPTRDGTYVPAQSLLTLIRDIQQRGQTMIDSGQSPPWTDIQILNNLDGKEIGNAINASLYSTELVSNYLETYKFRSWTHHQSTGNPVSDEEKRARAAEIAAQLCDNSLWRTHSRGITREIASTVCRLQVTCPETITGLSREIRRFWALCYWVFERMNICKIMISANYSLFRSDNSIMK